jgi:hypothetical protein
VKYFEFALVFVAFSKGFQLTVQAHGRKHPSPRKHRVLRNGAHARVEGGCN